MAVTRANVTLTSLGLTWQQRRNARGCAWGHVMALVGAWEHVRVWLESQKLLEARAGLDPADFDGNGQILMRSIQ